jgi:S1-C subfamily serine protease
MKRRVNPSVGCSLVFLLSFNWALAGPVELADGAQSVSDQGQRKGRLIYPDERPRLIEAARPKAQRGDPLAQYELGWLLLNENEWEAMRWMGAAAEQGVAEAQWFIGGMYRKGEIVARDDQTAYFWFLLATSRGYRAALKDLDELEFRLTTEQRAAAQTAARDWKPKTATASPPTDPKTAAPASSAGTGFRIASERFITNHHVVANCQRLTVNGLSGRVKAVDTKADLALLTAPVGGTSVPLRAQRPLVGEAVAVAGYPLPRILSGFQLTTGTLASLSGIGGDTSQFQISAPVQSGNSGGPVLDAAGRVMGVVVSKLDAVKTARMTGDIPQNVNFAISGIALRSFLDANGIDYQVSQADRPLPTTSIAQQAQGFTVRVECWKLR